MATKKQGSRVTAKAAEEVTEDIGAWKKQSVKGSPLKVPSGNTCLARTVDLRTFVARGMIPNSLMPIIQKALSEGKPPSKNDFGELNPQMIAEMLDLADAVVIECVIKPPVAPPPADPTERRDDVLYVDEVDPDDKMFIFQWAVGGTRDLQRFRREQAAAMALVPSGEDVESEA